MRTGVLEQIWQGSIQPVEGVERNRLKRILQALLSTQIVLLTLSVIVSVLTLAEGRALALQGMVHLVLLATFIFLSAQP